MCGIFGLLNYDKNEISNINEQFLKGKERGPEFSKLETKYMKMVLGFHRLAINGLNEESNQPLVVNDVILICNGEIYNYKILYKNINIVPTTDSDCEIIIHLYIKYGIEQTLLMLDGVFSFILFDNRISSDLNNKLYIARDPLGVRPLYYLKNNKKNDLNNLYGFSSELKCLEYFYNTNINEYIIEQFKPGTYSIFNLSNIVNSYWEPIKNGENIPYFIPSFPYNWLNDQEYEDDFEKKLYKNIACYLNIAVTKRCLTTERPIACLLSGGLDSSLITALVNNFLKNNKKTNNVDYKLETYSIGLKGSEDLKYAKIVADYLGTNHTEIIVTEEEMFQVIPEVIKAIESFDTTTVRASIGNYLLGKYISKNSEAKVIFNGDGSDELLGGYLYMNKCPDDIEFDKETRRLLKDIHLFDVLRSDKCISSHGLEPRTPFLDRNFVNSILSLPIYYRNHTNNNSVFCNSLIEKYLLRESFTKANFENYKGEQILPDNILWRKKEAFSDGVSTQGRSLYTILQEKIANKINLETGEEVNPDIELEKKYYKSFFNTYYPNCEHILPYYWMPKYIISKDPSARTLSIYK
jgi:asparagine synthase (glutamine-hydrolysing)